MFWLTRIKTPLVFIIIIIMKHWSVVSQVSVITSNSYFTSPVNHFLLMFMSEKTQHIDFHLILKLCQIQFDSRDP